MGVPQQLDGLFHGQFQIIMGALVAGCKWNIRTNIRTTSWKIRTKIPTTNWTMPSNPNKKWMKWMIRGVSPWQQWHQRNVPMTETLGHPNHRLWDEAREGADAPCQAAEPAGHGGIPKSSWFGSRTIFPKVSWKVRWLGANSLLGDLDSLRPRDRKR